MSKVHVKGVGATLPRCAGWSWNFADPLKHIGATIGILLRLGHETKGVVGSPFLSLLLETVEHDLVRFLLVQLFVHLSIDNN
mgnify:FL=1|jgi:hypothetical protein